MEAADEIGPSGEELSTRKPPPGPRLRVRWLQAQSFAKMAVLWRCAELYTPAYAV